MKHRYSGEVDLTRRPPLGLAVLLGGLVAAFLILPAGGAAGDTPGGPAGGPRGLTLEQALAVAAERNRDIEKAREYIAWAKGKYVEERAAALPQLAAVGSLVRDRDESQKIYSPIQTERTDRRTAQITLTQPLFTWGQVSAAIRAATAGLKSADEQLRT